MAESTRLVDLVQADLDEFLTDRERILAGIAPDLLPLVTFSRDLLSGGKRFRALFCYWGWHAAGPAGRDIERMPLASELSGGRLPGELSAVVHAASALEVFHAAALVHDDIMDNSDTRRGIPAVHRRFESMHVTGGFGGSAGEFGSSAALLLGDLLLGWSDELFDRATDGVMSETAARGARREFNQMRTEVTAGQYLDILDERSWLRHPESDLLARAHRVIVYKSAKYSVEAPLVIGATLADATPDQIGALRGFGLPLGIAYQLRDDLLGVFGDPALTGKPAGDDLREGKRTVLIALARAHLPSSSRRLLDELLGDENLSGQQIRMLQASIEGSGAIGLVERLIAHNVRLALDSIEAAPISREARHQLASLADTVTRRVA